MPDCFIASRAMPPGNELLRFHQGGELEVSEDRCFEERFATGILSELWQSFLNRTVALKHLRHSRNITRLPEDVPECSRHTLRCAVVNPRIDAIDVAGGALCPIGLALEDMNRMFAFEDSCSIQSDSEFKRHVEPWNAMRGLNTRQIMDRYAGFLDQLEDHSQAILIRKAQRCRDVETELSEADSIGRI